MNIKLDPNLCNKTEKKEKQSEEELRVTAAKQKLFKVKHADNDILYSNPEDSNSIAGGHYALTVGINPETEEVVVAVLASLEDQNGNPTKTDKVKNNFIYPIPEDKITGNSRKSGVSLTLYKKNLICNRNLKFDDLDDSYNKIEISKAAETDIAKHLFENPTHKKMSKRNSRIVESMLKIK